MDEKVVYYEKLLGYYEKYVEYRSAGNMFGVSSVLSSIEALKKQGPENFSKQREATNAELRTEIFKLLDQVEQKISGLS